MTEIPEGLTPANQNPWYVLMTLYGEQEGEKVDWNLHAKNRAAWNGWASSGLSVDERKKWNRSKVDGWNGWMTEWSRVQEEHKRQMQARNGAGFVYPGYPEPSQKLDMRKLMFDHAVVAQGMLFPVDTDLLGATFGGQAWFNDATFCGKALFNNSRFQGNAEFGEAKFNDSAEFNKITFRGVVAFDGATFSGPAEFEATRFSDYAEFHRVGFSKDVNFNFATFDRPVWFNGAKFGGDVIFFSAWFIEDVEFDLASFSGFARFTNAVFGEAGGAHRASFFNCKFEKPTSFSDAIFHATYPDFSGVELHDQTSFTPDPDNWPNGPQSDPAAAKASCAVIRHNLGKQGLPEAEHFFFRREMGFAGHIGGWWQRLPYRAFGVFSDYGYSIARPSLWLLGLWVAVAMVNHVVLQWGASMGGLAGYHPAQAFGLSFANLFPIFELLSSRSSDCTSCGSRQSI